MGKHRIVLGVVLESSLRCVNNQPGCALESALVMPVDPSLPPRYLYRHLGGSLPLEDPTYVAREADAQLYQALRDGEFCYVLNSRQMGKSSLRVRVMQRLQADGVACGVVDLSAMGTESTQAAWYKGLAYRVMRNFRGVAASKGSADGRKFDWRGWWGEHDFLSPLQQLGELIVTCCSRR